MLKQALDSKLSTYLAALDKPLIEETYLRKSYKEAKMIWKFIAEIFYGLPIEKLSNGYSIMIDSYGYSRPEDKVNGFPQFKKFEFMNDTITPNTITLVEKIALDEGIPTERLATRLVIKYTPPSHILNYNYDD